MEYDDGVYVAGYIMLLALIALIVFIIGLFVWAAKVETEAVSYLGQFASIV